MARQDADREDLISEAVALVHRVEFQLLDHAEPLVAGRRATGAWSFYFGPDPVYQFDAEGLLRRAFVDGRLYRTQGTALAEMTPDRNPQQTALVRRDLIGDELTQFLSNVRTALVRLRDQLWEEKFQILRSVGFDVPPRSAVADALHTILSTGLRLAPAVPTRKS